GGLQGLVGGEHDDLGGGADLLEGVQDVEAGAAGHADVEDGDVDRVGAGESDGFVAVGGEQDAVVLMKNDADGLAGAFLVVHDQQVGQGFFGGGGGHGQNA